MNSQTALLFCLYPGQVFFWVGKRNMHILLHLDFYYVASQPARKKNTQPNEGNVS